MADAKPSYLMASPLRAGLAAAFFLVVALFCFLMPLLTGTSSFPAYATFWIIAFIFGFPGYQLARMALHLAPLLVTDGETVSRPKLGIGRKAIAWEQVGEIGLRGIWLILLDGRIAQSRFTKVMFGARGLWIPGLLAEGGGPAVMNFVQAHRPDLMGPLMTKVSMGRTPGGWS